MISSNVSSRRRDVAKRVASFCGIVLILPLIGCSSQGVSLSEGYGNGTASSALIPPEPVYGEADASAGGSAFAADHTRAPYAAPVSSYHEASVQRGTLTPIASAAPQGPDAGGSFAMQPLDARDGARTPNATDATYQSAKRYAGSVPSYYERKVSDYRGDGYQPSGRAYEDQPRDGYSQGGPRQGGADYVVAPGDTIFSIAQRHGMSTTELAELNRLNGSTIHPGQRLRVRGPEYTSANRYRAPSAYEPRDRGRGGTAYADDDRKAPPVYSEDHGTNRYGSYSGYAGSMPKPTYARDEEDQGRDEYHGSGQSHAYADRPAEAEKRYDADKRYDAATPPRSDAPYYARPSRTDRPSYAERPSPSNGPTYSEQPYEEKKPPYAERQAYAGNPDYEEGPQEQHQDHYVHSDERDDNRAEEPRHEPRRLKAKGSYYNYSAKPGDTVADVARRNGLSVRELSEINDVPPSARLYPGQVLRLPKGKGYGQGERRDQGDDRDDRASSRRGRPGYDDRTSQKAPVAGERGSKDGERRVAQAALPQDRGEPHASDAAAPARPEADRAPQGASEPIMAAANRDMGPAEMQPGGEKAAQDCETLLASPASRSAQTFREPVQGMVTAKFGSKTDGTFNDGIDFSVPKGTPVKASENGVVAYAGNELPGFGNLVLVRHADGFVTAYAHNDELLVHRCDVVKRGQIISKAGASGTTSPQLHFELRKDSKPVDPEAFFARS